VDLGNDVEDAAVTHDLVRESGGGVSKAFPARVRLSGLVVGAPAGGLVEMAMAGPSCPCQPRTSSRDS
jgi:hypothetical protein